MNTNDYEIFRKSEYSEFYNNGKQYQLNSRPYLDIVLHDVCNAKCRFCIGDLVDERFTLDKDMAIKSIIEAKSMGVKEVLLLGGEPTLAKDLFWYIEQCKQIGFEKICMTTNGIRMSKDRHFTNQVLQSGITHLNISYMSDNKEQQQYITRQNHYVSLEDLKYFYDAQSVMLRINNNVFASNNGSVEQILKFYDKIKDRCNSVKFSPLMLTDNFSVVNEVNEFVRDQILSVDRYDELWKGVEDHFKGSAIVRNKETFGFVPYSMICLDTPIILNWNQHGKMMEKVVKENKINNIKLLSNGHLSLSWNRNDKERYLN